MDSSSSYLEDKILTAYIADGDAGLHLSSLTLSDEQDKIIVWRYFY
jgi:hypothetical protein